MPSISETITSVVVHELDAGGDMIEVRSTIDADRFHCFCLVTGKRSFLRRRYCSTDLTLEDILEREEGKGQLDKLDPGLQGQKTEFQAMDLVESTTMFTVKLPREITVEGNFHGSHKHKITILGSRISQQYLDSLKNRKLKRELPTSFLSMRTRGEDLYLVIETLQTAKEETLTSERQYTFWNQLNFCSLKYERKHQRAVTIPSKLVLGYRIKQLVFPNMERMDICFSGKTKSFPEEKDGGSSCLGTSLSLGDFRSMREKVQDTVRSLQDLTEEERHDVLSYLTRCLATDEKLQGLDERVSEVLISGELQMEGPAGPLLSSLFNAAGILVEARRAAILEFLDALKELSEEKELMAETLKKGTLPLLKDQVESILEQKWGGQPGDEGCDPEAQTLCALYVAVSILLQLSEKPASVSSC